MKLMESELVRSSLDHLKSALLDFPQVKVASESVEVHLNGNYQADAQLNIEVHGKPYSLVLEAKALLTPARLRAFLSDPAWLHNVKRTGIYGVVAAPFLSEDSVKLCQEAGVGAVDAEGNCWLNFGGLSVRHLVKTKRGPSAKEKSISPLRYPKAQKVLLGALDVGVRDWKMKELAELCEVSLGQAFKVCLWLVEQEWADRPRRGHFKIIKPEAVIDALAAAYQADAREQHYYFSLESREKAEEELAGALDFVEKTLLIRSGMLKQGAVLYGFSAARRWAPFVRHLRAQLYVPGRIPDLVNSTNVKLEPANQGANVILTVPKNENVFFRASSHSGVWVTSLVQTYLDLLKEPVRGEEAAEKVKEFWLERFHRGAADDVV